LTQNNLTINKKKKYKVILEVSMFMMYKVSRGKLKHFNKYKIERRYFAFSAESYFVIYIFVMYAISRNDILYIKHAKILLPIKF
jgi:hypothetical protein